MKEVNSNAEALKRNFLDLTELKHILRKTQSFFDEVVNAYYQTRVCNNALKCVGFVTRIQNNNIGLRLIYDGLIGLSVPTNM